MPELVNRKRWEAELRRAFVESGKRYRSKLIDYMRTPPNPNNIPATFWKTIGNDLRQKLEPILQGIYEESVAQMMAATTIPIEWTLGNAAAAAWAKQYSYTLVRQINTTTEARLQGIFSDFFTQRGKTVGDMRKLIAPEVKDLTVRMGDGTTRLLTSAQRAKLIATTEVTRASVEGEKAVIAQIEDAGIEMVAIWETQQDAKVCPLCRPLQGKEQGDGWTDPPPAHPGCFCNLRYEPRVKEGKTRGREEWRTTSTAPFAQAASETPRKNPVSGALQVPGGPKMQPVRDTLKAIDTVHDDGNLPTIPVDQKVARRSFGTYWSLGNRAGKISVKTSGEHPRLTTAHEVGHFLDHQAIGSAGRFASNSDPLLNEWGVTVERSQAYQALASIKPGTRVEVTLDSGQTFTYQYDRKYIGYLQRNEELFARSYAQYIAERSGDEALLKELDQVIERQGKQPLSIPTQWEHEDFRLIAEAFDRLFAAQGWR